LWIGGGLSKGGGVTLKMEAALSSKTQINTVYIRLQGTTSYKAVLLIVTAVTVPNPI
jgi:hypothetical protein